MHDLWLDEVAQVVAENREEVQETVSDLHHLLRSEKEVAALGPPAGRFPLVKVRGGAQFAAKRDFPALQIADVCAFVIRGIINDRREYAPFYNLLHPVMLAHPKMLQWPMTEWPMGPLVPLWKQIDEDFRALTAFRRALRRRSSDP